MNDKEILKNKLASVLISEGREDFSGEQNIANALLASGLDSPIVPVCIYTVAVKKFLEKCKYDQALEWLNHVLFFKNDYYQAYFRKGGLYRELSKYNEAIQCYNDGIDHYNKDEDPQKSIYDGAWGYLERAICYTKLRDYKKAQEDFIKTKDEMFNTGSEYSAGFNLNEVQELVGLACLAQSDEKIEKKLQDIINNNK